VDEHSRYVVHWEMMSHMDGETLSLEAERAIETLCPPGAASPSAPRPKPEIQTDNGSGYISQEFKKALSEHGIGHVRITPHCPEENGLVERANRTVGEALAEHDLEDVTQARKVLGTIIHWYNDERLHSALHFLRPMDYYRGEPEKLLAERARKMAEARHRRREANLGVRQTTIPFEAVDNEAEAPTTSKAEL
jgi:putative transposase